MEVKDKVVKAILFFTLICFEGGEYG